LEHISGHMKEEEVIWNSQHGFNKSKSYLMKLVVFCSKMTEFVDERKAVDVILGKFIKEV